MIIRNLLNIIKYLPRSAKPKSTFQTKSDQPYKPSIKFSQDEISKLSHPDKKISKSIYKLVQKREASGQQKQQIKYEKKLKKDPRTRFKHFSTPYIQKIDRITPSQMQLDDFAKVRLDIQYLPPSYLKKVQKIFNKYDHQTLRQIMGYFSKLMSLRYTEEKFDYDLYPELGFEKLEQKLPKEKMVEQIYLTSKEKILEEIQYKQTRKVDDQPIKPQISYTQNIVISYLLNRVPRTFATAIRIFVELKYRFPDWKPTSMIDFGSGLSSGSYAFIDVFEDTGMVYNVEPNGKMRKLGKYLTQDTKIAHYQTLGELSRYVKQVDVVYMGYVLTQLKPQMVDIYLEGLNAKVKNGGFFIIAQYGSPFGSRLTHQVRKWALQKGNKIIAPCPHQLKCPLTSGNQWCHFDQPTGMYPKSIFGTLPTDNSVKLEKFTYLIIQKIQKIQQQVKQQQLIDFPKQNICADWQRVVFPPMKRGKHIIVSVCSKTGTFDRRISAKSHGSQYKHVKKLKWGDFWRFGKRIPNKFRKERKTGKRLW